MTRPITLTINGKKHAAEVEPRLLLIHFIRDSAGLTGPWDAALDSAGNLVIADTGDNRVRVVAESTNTFYGQAMTAGDIYTVAGTGNAGFAGDGGAATSAYLSAPESAITDPAGDVVISDTGNGRVRLVAG